MRNLPFPTLWRALATVMEGFVDVVEPAVARLAPARRFVVVETREDDLAFYRVSGRRTVFLGKGAALPDRVRQDLGKGRDDVELRLDAERVILARIKVPAEATGFAAQIVESRLDRLTPWKPDRLLHGFALAPKPGGDGQTEVEIAATAREIAAAAMARLAVYGLTPSRIGSAAEPIEAPLRIDLLRGESDTARKRRRQRIATASLAVLFLSFAGFLASLHALSLGTRQVTDADAALSAVRRTLVDGAGSDERRQREIALLGTKTPERASFVLIDRLASILPDTTFLDELEIRPDSVRLAGSSTEASALVSILEAEPGFSQAAFAAPVTRQEDGRDRFDISVLRTANAAAAPP